MESMEKQGRQAGEFVGAAAEQLKGTASEMAERAKRASARMGEIWENTRSNVQEKSLASARATDRAIRDYPYASLGIAFGLGMLIGLLVNRGE